MAIFLNVKILWFFYCFFLNDGIQYRLQHEIEGRNCITILPVSEMCGAIRRIKIYSI